MQAQDMNRWVALAAFLLLGAGCATVPSRDVMTRAGLIPIPEITLAEAPAPVRATIETAAAGRRILRIHRVKELEGFLYRAYVTSRLGPDRVTVAHDGKLVDHAKVVPFEAMPGAVREAAVGAIAGEMGLCRRGVGDAANLYFVDYVINMDEPVFAVIEASGRVLTAIGYAQED